MSYTSSAASSRRQSMMLPPALGSPGLGGPFAGGAESGPGPHRHPKPLTAADLHLQLEREQEAVVNRLTRELAALRAQQIHSPIATNNSALEDITHSIPNTAGTSPILHHSYIALGGGGVGGPRHHRTGSNTSISAVTNTTTGAVAGNLSRQNSTRSIRSVNTGGRSSPAIGDLLPLPPHGSSLGGGREPAMTPPIVGGSVGTYPYAGYYGYQYQGGLGVSAAGSEVSLPLAVETPGGGGGSYRGGSSLAETIQWRNELESVKKENEALRQRVRELEKVLKEAAGVEPEGWSGGSVASLGFGTSGRRSARSRSSSVMDRGRKDVKVLDEQVEGKEAAEGK
ncbi:hypothetical protein DFH27DRAFT_566228 [Peziza echinospora]|nr:hypothetical protein DFH27DRAFT_566228 [Peziza echinospora]